MKLSKAIIELNKLRKKHGDVEIYVVDDNNGGIKEFEPYFDDDMDVKASEYAIDPNAIHHHKGAKTVLV